MRQLKNHLKKHLRGWLTREQSSQGDIFVLSIDSSMIKRSRHMSLESVLRSVPLPPGWEFKGFVSADDEANEYTTSGWLFARSHAGGLAASLLQAAS